MFAYTLLMQPVLSQSYSNISACVVTLEMYGCDNQAKLGDVIKILPEGRHYGSLSSMGKNNFEQQV